MAKFRSNEMTEISIQECLPVSTRDGGTCYNTGENSMNRISMEQISFAVALKHSYSDYKFNVSTVSSKMVGTYTTAPPSSYTLPRV